MQNATDNNDACTGFLDKLDMWLAGELKANHNLAMQAHHDACPACRLETRLARAVDTITAALPAQVCPELQLPVVKQISANPKMVEQQAASQVAPSVYSYIARLLHAWRQPLVYIPAAALMFVTLFVIQLLTSNTVVEPEIVIIDGREYTREEIIRATDDLEIALRYLDKYASYPARVVQSELEESRLPLPPPQEQKNTPSI